VCRCVLRGYRILFPQEVSQDHGEKLRGKPRCNVLFWWQLQIPESFAIFAGAAATFGIRIANIPNFSSLPEVVEDGTTFEANARQKAESYSLPFRAN